MPTHLKDIRDYELKRVSDLLENNHNINFEELFILEIGPGENPIYKNQSFRIIDYIGLDINEEYLDDKIQFNNEENVKSLKKKVELIFSSSSIYYFDDPISFLNHVDELSNAIEVHVIPTANWRLFTQVSVYISKIIKSNNVSRVSNEVKEKDKLLDYIFLKSHHYKVNRFIEFLYYRENRWKNLFRKLDKEIFVYKSNLFYTGKSVLGSKLNLDTRRKMAKYLGSSSKIYVLVPNRAS
ncbi:MAG: hypothetical protein CL470_08145 [Acidimicrobiaceae bacterium]|nr:hypothetical protein [Acidimicrobiaceae bacterium]|tara:strand:+ start:73 stop:789 length:717 start_codon:yes stop_codon:yes gene_type:complete